MIATLCIPRPPIQLPDGQIINSKAVYRFRLRWTDHHPASHYGLGVLLDYKGECFDGFMFKHLRDMIGAWITTDDPPRIYGALGIPKNEPGVLSK
jgi:hypothetical protein